jgi:hypothetical protein
MPARTLIKPKGDARYVRRNPKGQFKGERRRGPFARRRPAAKAKTVAKKGYGDRGDQKR